KDGHCRPKRRRRREDGHPGSPDSLTLPELGIRGQRRYAYNVRKSGIEWNASPNANQDLSRHSGSMPREEVANECAREGVRPSLITLITSEQDIEVVEIRAGTENQLVKELSPVLETQTVFRRHGKPFVKPTWDRPPAACPLNQDVSGFVAQH